MNCVPLLAVNWEDIFSFLVGLVVLLVWLVSQINDAKKKSFPSPPAEAPLPPPQPVQPPQPEAMAEAQQPDPLRAQVDEFLRRAKQPERPVGQPVENRPAAAAPRPQDEIVVLIDETPPQTPRLQPALPRSASVPAARRPKREKPRGQRGKSVAEHVAERIGSSSQQFRKEVADLGSRVILADKQFDEQLEQKFRHPLGTLGQTATTDAYDVQAVDKSSPAAQIAAMLATPDGIRQAIVVNEILRRPSDRW